MADQHPQLPALPDAADRSAKSDTAAVLPRAAIQLRGDQAECLQHGSGADRAVFALHQCPAAAVPAGRRPCCPLPAAFGSLHPPGLLDHAEGRVHRHSVFARVPEQSAAQPGKSQPRPAGRDARHGGLFRTRDRVAGQGLHPDAGAAPLLRQDSVQGPVELSRFRHRPDRLQFRANLFREPLCRLRPDQRCEPGHDGPDHSHAQCGNRGRAVQGHGRPAPLLQRQQGFFAGREAADQGRFQYRRRCQRPGGTQDLRRGGMGIRLRRQRGPALFFGHALPARTGQGAQRRLPLHARPGERNPAGRPDRHRRPMAAVGALLGRRALQLFVPRPVRFIGDRAGDARERPVARSHRRHRVHCRMLGLALRRSAVGGAGDGG